MKKHYLWMIAVALVALTACSKQVFEDETMQYDDSQQRLVRFDVQGDFETVDFTRGSLTADGKSMTDLWVLDYMDGTLVAQLHQVSTDEDFGTPQMALDFGEHHLYFVASRGKTPTLSTSEHTISWVTTSDTFWKDMSLEITTGSAASQSVVLQRVATKMTVNINDEVPEGMAAIEITPESWFYGLNYMTGTAVHEMTSEPRTINIPSTYIGTKGEVSASIYGISSTTEWTTDVSVVAKDSDDDIIGQAVIRNAPFKANRVTTYSGDLFSSESTFSITTDDQWETEHNGTW